MAKSNIEQLLAAVRTWLALEYPGERCIEIKLKLAHGRRAAIGPTPWMLMEKGHPKQTR